MISLPWPPAMLSPNKRPHWAQRASLTKRYRSACYTVARYQGLKRANTESVKMTMRFCPPDRRRRDMDNLIASTKALRDGLMDALGVDDSRFVVTYEMGEPVKGGAVQVEIAE